MQTKGNEFFYKISGLMLPKNNVYDDLIERIDSYVDKAQNLVESLQSNFNDDRMNDFCLDLRELCDLLKSVSAKWLETDGWAVYRMARSGSKEACEKMLSSFISDVLTLSIDMQVARNTDIQERVERSEGIDSLIRVTNNLRAIEKLIEIQDYEKAIYFVSNTGEICYTSKGITLVEDLKKGAAESSLAAVQDMMALFKGKIVKLCGTDRAIFKKVLVVDDKPDILTALSRMLKNSFQVSAVTNGVHALNILEAQKPDVIILDIEMPDMDGFQIAQSIRSHAVHKVTPIIFMTGNSSKEYVTKAINCGGNDFIVKPVNKDLLFSKLYRVLGIF